MKRDLNIIDLISENILYLEGVLKSDGQSLKKRISHTEALLLAKINMGKISIAEVARQANISRQAMFKCAKN